MKNRILQIIEQNPGLLGQLSIVTYWIEQNRPDIYLDDGIEIQDVLDLLTDDEMQGLYDRIAILDGRITP